MYKKMRFLYTFHEYIKKMRFSFYMDIIPEQTGHLSLIHISEPTRH